MKEKNICLKTSALLCLALTLLAASGCKSSRPAAETASQAVSGGDALEDVQKIADVDLTELSATMVYSEVYNMIVDPGGYEGKTVKIKGIFSVYHDEASGRNYFACLIPDATECCSQGMEFELEGEHTYPDDYPQAQEEITVMGVFRTYEENGNQYCYLKDARFL